MKKKLLVTLLIFCGALINKVKANEVIDSVQDAVKKAANTLKDIAGDVVDDTIHALDGTSPAGPDLKFVIAARRGTLDEMKAFYNKGVIKDDPTNNHFIVFTMIAYDELWKGYKGGWTFGLSKESYAEKII